MYISDVCKEHRKLTKLSNSDISEGSGIPLNTVNKFLSIGSKAPSVYTVGPICRVLGVSLDEYFGIVSGDMGQEERDRVTESYEKNKAELEQTIEQHIQQAASREELMSAKSQMVGQMEDRVTYMKTAIKWLRLLVGCLAGFSILSIVVIIMLLRLVISLLA